MLQSFWHSLGGRVKTGHFAEVKVTVDPKYAPFDEFLIQSMCSQAGSTREKFYGAIKATAVKIGLRSPKEETAEAAPTGLVR